MKRITEYRKLFNAQSDSTLKELKSTYRSLVKEWHPDKFQNGDALAEEAEAKSLKIIDAYHFLVSLSPETRAANQEEYKKTIETSRIADFKYKGLMLEVIFQDGSTYEYFGVSKNVYSKLVNSDKQNRFAKRNIFSTFLYRKSKRDLQTA